MVRQIPESEYSGPPLTEGAAVFLTPEALSVGQPVLWEHYEDDGLGPARIAFFRTADGCWFALDHHEYSPRKDLMTMYVGPDDRSLHVDAALSALGLTSADLRWLAPGLTLRPSRLIRQDDNGVQFHVGDFPCRADADAVIRRLTYGAHKQGYFLEAIPEGGPRLLFPNDCDSPPAILQ